VFLDNIRKRACRIPCDGIKTEQKRFYNLKLFGREILAEPDKNLFGGGLVQAIETMEDNSRFLDGFTTMLCFLV